MYSKPLSPCCRTTSKFTAMAGFLEDVLTYFQWDHVTLVTTDNRVWIETEEELLVGAIDDNDDDNNTI